MFYALAEGKIDTGGLALRARAAGHRDAQPARAARRSSRSRPSRSTPTPTWPTATRCCRTARRWATATARGSSHAQPMRRADVRGQADRHSRDRSPPPISRSGSTSPTSRRSSTPFDQIEDAVRARRRGRGTADPRGPAHLRRPRPAPRRRHGRVVARARPACRSRSAATWSGKDLGADADRADLAPPPRPASRTASSTATAALDHAMQYARGLDARTRRHVRRHVRERVDARLRRARPGGGALSARPRSGRWADPAPGHGRVRRDMRASEFARGVVFTALQQASPARPFTLGLSLARWRGSHLRSPSCHWKAVATQCPAAPPVQPPPYAI